MTSEDQQAVSEYFASERFQRQQTGAEPPPSWPPPRVNVERWLEPGLSSLVAGPLGLAMIAVFFGVMMPVGMEIFQDVFSGRPRFMVQSLLFQSLFFPPMIAFAFAAVTPMFWYGSVTLRFLFAAAATFPGCLGFYAALYVIEGNPGDDFWIGFSIVMWTSFVVIAGIAVSVQLWSRWSMSHDRYDPRPIRPPGIGAMIELTAIAAVGFSVFVSSEVVVEYIEGVLFFGGMGALMSIAVISASIAYFRPPVTTRSRWGLPRVISLIFAFSSACLLNGFIATMEFGWDVLTGEFLMIGLASLYGAAVILLLMWLCLRWLRLCGWSCERRGAGNRTAEPVEETAAAVGPIM